MASKYNLLNYDRDDFSTGIGFTGRRPFQNLVSAAIYLGALFSKNYILYAFTGDFAEKLRDLFYAEAWHIDVVVQASTQRVLDIVGSEERVLVEEDCYNEGVTKISVKTGPMWDNHLVAHMIGVDIIPCGRPALEYKRNVAPRSLEYERDLLLFELPITGQHVSFHVVSLRFLMSTMLVDCSSHSSARSDLAVTRILVLMKKYATEIVTFADNFMSADVDHFLQALPQDSRQEMAVCFGR